MRVSNRTAAFAGVRLAERRIVGLRASGECLTGSSCRGGHGCATFCSRSRPRAALKNLPAERSVRGTHLSRLHLLYNLRLAVAVGLLAWDDPGAFGVSRTIETSGLA
jgi:hypothetical protein